MFKKEKLGTLKAQFQRIFTLPLTRTTFREISNAVLTASEGDTQKANTFIESLILNGGDAASKEPETKEFISQFSIPTRVAKEVHDRGNVLSMLTTDVGLRGDSLVFSSRLRRTDGGDFHFVADTDGILQLMDHFVIRLRDGGKEEKGKESIKKAKERISTLSKHLDELSKI